MAGRRPQIHEYARQGDVSGVQAELAKGVPVDMRDPGNNWTPLMTAVSSPSAGVEMVRLLIKHMADVNATATFPHAAGSQEATRQFLDQVDRDPQMLNRAPGLDPKMLEGMRAMLAADIPEPIDIVHVFGQALMAGDMEKVRVVLDAGADVLYLRNGYDALIDVMHGRAIEHDPQLVPLVRLLIERGARLDTVTRYSESALRVSSNRGRFDVVRVLLDAGADPAPLGWTPLMRAVALRAVADVQAELEETPYLEEIDSWDRTAWLLSLQVGDVAKAKLLLAAGADRTATGRCDKPALMYPIRNGHLGMLRWLLAEGFDPNETDEFGRTALTEAAEAGATESVRYLLEAGADVHHRSNAYAAIEEAASLEIVDLLVAAGADLNDISDEMRAALTRVPFDERMEATAEEYRDQKHRRFGRTNPEQMNLPFWRSMIRSGLSAYGAREYFDDLRARGEAVWCFRRFGKSITKLPDGRIIEIAGEHEDSYDPDFCIYNDVVVHHGDGTFDIYGYPKECFPPTDFHSATHVGNWLYIIGSLGYHGERRPGHTPVYRLDLDTYRIEGVATSGDSPGWIHKHKAQCIGTSQIRVTGGEIYVEESGRGDLVVSPADYILDLTTFRWHKAPSQ